MNELLVKIRFLIPSLPRRRKHLHRLFWRIRRQSPISLWVDIARESNSSDASIIRLANG